MKKTVVMTALILFAVSSVSFGAAVTSGNVTASSGLQIFGGPDATAAADAAQSVLIGKMSKGVMAGFNFDNANYAVNTKHTSGDKAFGTAADSTAIFNTTLGTGALTAAPDQIDNTAFASWTQM